jgi:hypothetical protein
MRDQPEYRHANGETVKLSCDWCGDPASKVITVAPGRRVGFCEPCEDRAYRFQASLDPKTSFSSLLQDTAWLPSPTSPDLVIHSQGKSPITIRDHRQLKAKALKELLPPAKLPRKKKPLSASARAKDIARRRRELDRDLRELLAHREDLSMAEIAEVVGVPPQQLEELAA